MGLVTQILPTLFLVILLFSPKTQRIKRLKVQSYLHSGFVGRKAFLIQELRPKWSGYGSLSPEARTSRMIVCDRGFQRQNADHNDAYALRECAVCKPGSRGSNEKEAERTHGQ